MGRGEGKETPRMSEDDEEEEEELGGESIPKRSWKEKSFFALASALRKLTSPPRREEANSVEKEREWPSIGTNG